MGSISLPAPLSQSDEISQILSKMSFHGPYEDAIIAVANTVRVIIEGQDPAFRKEMGERFLESTKPLHELSVQIGTQISNLLAQVMKTEKK